LLVALSTRKSALKPLSPYHSRFYHPLLGVTELVAFDLETTGLRPAREEITQIAGVKLSGLRMEMEDSFTTYVNPGKPIPENIQKLTRVRDSNVRDAPSPSEAIQAFSDFVGNATLFGHDIYRFDLRFIHKHVDSDDSTETRPVPFIDTMDIFEAIWPDFSRLRNTLDDIAERVSAGLSSIRRHDAQGDAILLAQIFQRIQDHPRLEYYTSRIPVHEARLPVLSPIASNRPHAEISDARKSVGAPSPF